MFPRPRCEGCGSRDACDLRGVARAEYPSCRTPLRPVDMARMAGLFAWLARNSGAVGADVSALATAVIERFGRDRHTFSDILELSFSCDPDGDHLYRFSYAFPGFRADEAGVAATLLAFCRPFGPRAEEAVRTALRAARSRAVEQLLFGFAFAPDGGSRVKLYLQFRNDGGAAGLELATRMLGAHLGALSTARRLHLLCLDVGSAGLSGAKLYVVEDRLELATLATRIGEVPLVAALAPLGVSSLRDVLVIHRVTGPDDETFTSPSELDFSLADNDLLWDDVRALPDLTAQLARSPRLGELAASFRLATRRISGSVGDGRKINVYYTLAERERPEARPDAG